MRPDPKLFIGMAWAFAMVFLGWLLVVLVAVKVTRP